MNSGAWGVGSLASSSPHRAMAVPREMRKIFKIELSLTIVCEIYSKQEIV